MSKRRRHGSPYLYENAVYDNAPDELAILHKLASPAQKLVLECAIAQLARNTHFQALCPEVALSLGHFRRVRDRRLVVLDE